MKHTSKNYVEDGGDTFVVTGKIDVKDGGEILKDGEELGGDSGNNETPSASEVDLSSINGLNADNVQDAIQELLSMVDNGGTDE